MGNKQEKGGHGNNPQTENVANQQQKNKVSKKHKTSKQSKTKKSKPSKKNKNNPPICNIPVIIVSEEPTKEWEVKEFLSTNPVKEIKPKIYKDGEWEIVEPETIRKSMTSSSRIKSLEIVTYNIWFGTREETVQEISPRITELMSLIHTKKPDIICLQEMTDTIMQVIESIEWVQKSYWISGNNYSAGYGITILSRFPVINIVEQKFPTKLGRSLLVAQFEVNKEKLFVGTVHLESYAKDYQTRKKQLIVAKEYLTGMGGNSMLMGDFNFADENECIELSFFLSPYIDVWKQLRPDEIGFTYDMQENIMLNETLKMKGREDARNRIDLILYNCAQEKKFKPELIELLGTEEILKDRKIPDGHKKDTIFPSDHFGLHATFLREPTSPHKEGSTKATLSPEH